MTGGDYEVWVHGLRAWRHDPTTDLTHLPPLRADSFSPATYGRLLRHLQDALEFMMSAWNDRLGRAVENAAGPHELAWVLQQSRRELARRLVLARHSGFPPEIRSELEKAVDRDIRGIQQQLEDSAAAGGSERATSGREERETQLKVLRENSFVALLAPGLDLELLLRPVHDRPVDETETVRSSSSLAPPPAPARRRIVIDPS